MRSFVAIEISEQSREALRLLGGRLRGSDVKASWVRAGNLHITLRFLGDVEPGDLDVLAEVLAKAYSGVEPFSLRVEGVGAFPNPRRPRVVWAGVTGPETPLASIHQISEMGARAIGLAPEKKGFSPHITLGRIRDPRAGSVLPGVLNGERDFDGGEFEVRNVSLFSSTLTPKGPVYGKKREFPLRWTSSPEPSTAS